MNQNGNIPQEPFVDTLQRQAIEKRHEYLGLLHEQNRVALNLERVKTYIQALNKLLEAEGQPQIPLREPGQANGVGRPGNRSTDMPLRKAEWQAMSLSDIVDAILRATPSDIHADPMVHLVYEIERDADMRKAKHTLVSVLRTGAKAGRWLALGRNRYRGNPEQQRMLEMQRA